MHKYTKAEKDQVIARLKADPKTARKFLDSAQSGNREDLNFLMQMGGDLFVSEDVVSFIPFAKDDPRADK